MDRASIYTIAERAGVSTATVSRALSGKDGVRPETRQRILDAAKELDYRPSRLARRLSAPDITIAVFFTGSQFEEFGMDIFRGAYDACRELSDYHVKVRLCYFPQLRYGRASEQAVDEIVHILDSGVQGVISLPGLADHRQNARIREAVERNDIALAGVIHAKQDERTVYAYHSDAYTAGELAAELLWTALGDGAKVSIFTGYRDGPVHSEGIRGFRDAVQRYPLELLTIYENYDDPQMAYHATDALLRNHPDVQGIYVASANSRMVCRRIEEEGRDKRICMITSDIYPELGAYLERGLVRATIIQAQYNQAFKAFRALANYLITRIPPEKPVHIIRPWIVLRSNARQFLISESDKTTAACRAVIERYEF